MRIYFLTPNTETVQDDCNDYSCPVASARSKRVKFNLVCDTPVQLITTSIPSPLRLASTVTRFHTITPEFLRPSRSPSKPNMHASSPQHNLHHSADAWVVCRWCTDDTQHGSLGVDMSISPHHDRSLAQSRRAKLPGGVLGQGALLSLGAEPSTDDVNPTWEIRCLPNRHPITFPKGILHEWHCKWHCKSVSVLGPDDKMR